MNAKPILMHGRSIQNLLAGRKTQTRRILPANLAEAIEWIGGRADEHPTTSDDVRLRWQEHIDEDTSRSDGPEWCVASAEYPEEGVVPIGKGYGNVGDLLYVRETWRVGAWRAGKIDTAIRGECPVWGNDNRIAIDYAADDYCRREWLHVPDDALHEKLVDQSLQDARAAGFTDDNGDIRWRPGESPCRWRRSIHMPRWASRITLHLTDVRVERAQEISEADAKAEGVEAFFPGVDYQHSDRDRFRALWNFTNGKGAWDHNDWCWVLCFDVIHANVDQIIADPARYGIQGAAA